MRRVRVSDRGGEAEQDSIDDDVAAFVQSLVDDCGTDHEQRQAEGGQPDEGVGNADDGGQDEADRGAEFERPDNLVRARSPAAARTRESVG